MMPLEKNLQNYDERSQDSSSEESEDEKEPDLNKELKAAMGKAKIVLQRAIYSYAYYRISKFILNLVSTKIFASTSFFQWNIFGFA